MFLPSLSLLLHNSRVRELITSPGKDLWRECPCSKGTLTLHRLWLKLFIHPSIPPSFLPLIHCFTYFHYAKCYGYKDKSQTCSCKLDWVLNSSFLKYLAMTLQTRVSSFFSPPFWFGVTKHKDCCWISSEGNRLYSKFSSLPTWQPNVRDLNLGSSFLNFKGLL